MNIKLSKAHQLSRRTKFRGLDVSIETDKGELRHWYDPHNKTKGSTKMSHPYGYIRRTKGVDGDHVDVYIGPKEDAPNVYVVHQMKAPDFKKYDEDKCMVGFETAAAAKAAYLKNFDDPRFFGSMTTMPWTEFEKKVKATFEQPKKIAAFTLPIPSNVTVETTASPVTDELLGTAGTLGTVAALPSAGLWYAGRKGEQLLPQYQLVQPGVEGTAKRFAGLAGRPDLTANEFVRQYVEHGSRLAKEPAVKLPSGEVLTGAQLNERVRGQGITGRISELFTQKPFTQGSRMHYRAFAKGTVPAYAQMAQEAYEHGIKTPRAGGGEHVFKGRAGLMQDFTTTVGEARYEAAKELADKGKLHPARFRQKLVEVMQRKMPGSTPADVQRFVKSLEGQLLQASPKDYLAHLEAVRAGQDATHLQNQLLSNAGFQQKGRTTSAKEVVRRLRRMAHQQGIQGPVGKWSPEVQKKLLDQLAKADDPVMQLLNMRIREGWKHAPTHYGAMIEPLLGYQKAHGRALDIAKKLRKGGKAALITGGALATLPLLSKLLSGPEKVEKVKVGSYYDAGIEYALEKLGFGMRQALQESFKVAPKWWQSGGQQMRSIVNKMTESGRTQLGHLISEGGGHELLTQRPEAVAGLRKALQQRATDVQTLKTVKPAWGQAAHGALGGAVPGAGIGAIQGAVDPESSVLGGMARGALAGGALGGALGGGVRATRQAIQRGMAQRRLAY
jgi:hypothetical protein